MEESEEAKMNERKRREGRVEGGVKKDRGKEEEKKV